MAVKINLAKSAGFCFGVKRAINIAFKTISSGAKVYMLGDIVHNEDVMKGIQKAGIKKIKGLCLGKGKTLLIRAHGASRKIIRNAKGRGYKIVDATCTMVKEIHKIAKDMEEKGFKIIVIGDKLHDEVRGIIGQLKKKAIVIDDIKNIPVKAIRKIRKACVVVQSTQNIDKVEKIVSALKIHTKRIVFFNTICIPTRQKQDEIKRMPLENDVMVIIGSRTSANTKRLYEISGALNARTYWIRSKKDIRRGWFKDALTVGITAGASTPDSTTKSVIRFLKQLAASGKRPGNTP